MAEKEAKAVVDDDDDFELVTSARQLGTPPALRKEEVKIRDWPTTSGKKGVIFLAWELTGGEWADMADSGWTYKEGARASYDNKDEDFRFLAHTLRDQNRNRIWPTLDAAKAQLSQLGKADMVLLINAANKANSVKPVSAEKNSEATPTDS